MSKEQCNQVLTPFSYRVPEARWVVYGENAAIRCHIRRRYDTLLQHPHHT